MDDIQIVLYTYGNKSFIRKIGGQIFEFPSFILFQNRQQFVSVLKEIIKYKLQFSNFKKITSLILFLPGKIDKIRGIILRSEELNSFSLNGSYECFNVKAEIAEQIGPKTIMVISTIEALSIGAIRYKSREENSTDKADKSVVVLNLGDQLETGFAIDKIHIQLPHWGQVFNKAYNNTINGLIGIKGIYDLMQSEDKNLIEKYTEYLQHSIETVVSNFQDLNNLSVSDIILLGEYSNLFDETKIDLKWKDKFNTYILKDEAIHDCFIDATEHYLEKYGADSIYEDINFSNFKNDTLIKYFYLMNISILEYVEYYSGDKLIVCFRDKEKWKKHFISLKPFAKKKNYYVLNYYDTLKIDLSFDEIDYMFELDEYYFLSDAITSLTKK